MVDETVLDGVVEARVSADVIGPAAVAGATRLVVTDAPVRVGDKIDAGDVIVEISGRPVIVLPGRFPAYRDLAPGDAGPDVRQLQAALGIRYGTPVTGAFDERTERDLRRLYQRAGYRAAYRATKPVPTDQPAEVSPAEGSPADRPANTPAAVGHHLLLPSGEIAFCTLPATVTALPAAVGTTVDGPVATLAFGGWQVRVELDDETARMLGEADRPGLAFGQGPLKDRRTDLMKIQQVPASGGTPAKRHAVFSVAGRAAVRFGEAQQVVMTRARSRDRSTVVPVSALWTGTDGRVHVRVVSGTSIIDIPVDVLLTVGGEAAVTGELRDGDQVVVTDG
ncbi:hypothetical protein AB0C47_09865 [Micromonospora taraxaci]|uniref:hypothetical protein n=1 Tax=Micromonospora taraxaci TaxID=1316803 RepID=UPI0033E31C34